MYAIRSYYENMMISFAVFSYEKPFIFSGCDNGLVFDLHYADIITAGTVRVLDSDSPAVV